MRKILAVIAIILTALSLSACGAEEADPAGICQVYYLNNSETRVEVREHSMTAENPQAQIQELIEALSAMPDKLEYKAPLSMGFQLMSYSLEGGKLKLDMDNQYLNLSPTTEVLVRAAIVSTLTQLPEVSFVSFTVEGSPLLDRLGNTVGMMTAEQFIHNEGSEINTVEVAHLKLYFANEKGDALIAVSRDIHYNSNISLERLVVEQVIAGPKNVDGVYPTVNPDTKIGGVMTKDGICYVNLEDTFLNQIYNVSADATIYSLVNSLVELSNVNKVQISINGDTSGVYREKYSFSTMFERNLDLVTTLDPDKTP